MQAKKNRVLDAYTNIMAAVEQEGQEVVTNLEQSSLREKGLRMSFDLSAPFSINASAGPLLADGGRLEGYSVSVNRGTVVNLTILAQALLSREDVLPELGPDDVPFGSTWGLDLHDLHWGDNLFRQMSELLDKEVLICRMPGLRSLAADLVGRFGFLFVLWHEIGHVQRGHVDWYHREFGSARLFERGGVEGASPFSARALELAADAHAGVALAQVVQGIGGPYSALLAGFASALVFQTFTGPNDTAEDYVDAYHPHPWIRAMYTISGFAGRARKYDVELSADAERDFKKGAIAAASACHKYGIGSAFKRMTEEDPGSGDRELGELLDELDRVVLEKGMQKWVF